MTINRVTGKITFSEEEYAAAEIVSRIMKNLIEETIHDEVIRGFCDVFTGDDISFASTITDSIITDKILTIE